MTIQNLIYRSCLIAAISAFCCTAVYCDRQWPGYNPTGGQDHFYLVKIVVTNGPYAYRRVRIQAFLNKADADKCAHNIQDGNALIGVQVYITRKEIDI